MTLAPLFTYKTQHFYRICKVLSLYTFVYTGPMLVVKNISVLFGGRGHTQALIRFQIWNDKPP